MKKLMYVLFIVFFSQAFFSCTNDVEEDVMQTEKVQNDDGSGDDGSDDVINEEGTDG